MYSMYVYTKFVFSLSKITVFILYGYIISVCVCVCVYICVYVGVTYIINIIYCLSSFSKLASLYGGPPDFSWLKCSRTRCSTLNFVVIFVTFDHLFDLIRCKCRICVSKL